ncbi:MAG: replication initiator protein A [Faecalibacterium sp.]
MIGLFDDLTVCTPLPRYLPFPKFLLDAQLSHTAKLLYALLLDRATLSRKNNWTDEQGRIYVVYPIPKLAQTLGCSFSSITRSLTELTNAGLIERTRSGFSKPSRIFLEIPHTAQKCAATLQNKEMFHCMNFGKEKAYDKRQGRFRIGHSRSFQIEWGLLWQRRPALLRKMSYAKRSVLCKELCPDGKEQASRRLPVP